MKQKTAIDWLREQYHKTPQSQFGNLFEQAKKLEREQIEEAAVTVAQKAGNIVIENMKEPIFENHFNFDAAKAAKECREFAENYYQQKYGDEPIIKND